MALADDAAPPRTHVLTDDEWLQRSLATLTAAREAAVEAETQVLKAEATLSHDTVRAGEVRADQIPDDEIHIANLRVTLASHKTDAATRCEATVQAAINFPVPDDQSLRLRIETLSTETATLTSQLDSMDDSSTETRLLTQRNLDSTTLLLAQTREIHDVLIEEFSGEQIVSHMELLRASQREAQAQSALSSWSQNEAQRLTDLLSTARSALQAFESRAVEDELTSDQREWQTMQQNEIQTLENNLEKQRNQHSASESAAQAAHSKLVHLAAVLCAMNMDIESEEEEGETNGMEDDMETAPAGAGTSTDTGTERAAGGAQ
eukprot:2175060-Rhodomonas_salina.1